MTDTKNDWQSIEKLSSLLELVWDKQIEDQIFQRWCQGFTFSQFEPTALIQHSGGPCAVITPIQAYILLELLFNAECPIQEQFGSPIKDEQVDQLLIAAFVHVLSLCSSNRYTIVALPNEESGNASQNEDLSADYFHNKLRQRTFDDVDTLKSWMKTAIHQFQQQFGILTFLYSVIITKGVDMVQKEREETNEPLIDRTFGHGSQSLTNLMITGTAVSNVWDHSKSIGGMSLLGIQEQPNIGFLSLMESLRYCEVGSYLKNPANPIWILSSGTHLTVLFSTDCSLVSAREASRIAAIRTFVKYDEAENGFIPKKSLIKVMEELELDTDPDYVSFMANCMDKDNLGIILLNDFLCEFFPQIEDNTEPTRNFTLYHYNGLRDSNCEGKVVYNKCIATTLSEDYTVNDQTENQIIQCLRTKWKNLLKLECPIERLSIN